MAKTLAEGFWARMADFCMAIISSSTPSHLVRATTSGRSFKSEYFSSSVRMVW